MGAPFDNPEYQAWWRSPSHKRKCALARENVLEVAKAKGLARIRRQKLFVSLKSSVVFGGIAIVVGLILGEIYCVIRG